MKPIKQLTINGTSWMEFRDTMRDKESFRTYGNLHGTNKPTFCTGRLPKAFADHYFDRFNKGKIDYVVYSYLTPIAWHDTELGWLMPDVSYSVTTSKAQGRIAPGIYALRAGRENY